MSEAKKLTAKEEEWLRRASVTGYGALDSDGVARLFATLDAERAKVEALRDEKAAVEWMLEQDRAALAAAVTRATAAEAALRTALDQRDAAHAKGVALGRAAAEAEAQRVKAVGELAALHIDGASQRLTHLVGTKEGNRAALYFSQKANEIRAALAKEKPDAGE